MPVGEGGDEEGGVSGGGEGCGGRWGCVVSRRVRVPVGMPVVVLATWAVRVMGAGGRELRGGMSVVRVGAGLMVRVKAVLWALAWVRSPG